MVLCLFLIGQDPCDVMTDTVKQLFNLIWFCKKVSIPFDVYAFTCDYPRMDANGYMDLSREEAWVSSSSRVFLNDEYPYQFD